MKTILFTFLFSLLVFSAGFYFLLFVVMPKVFPTEVRAEQKTIEVIYSLSGFDPSPTTIEKDTLVVFSNRSGTAMWLKSKEGSELSGFGTEAFVNPGQSYTYLFNEKGTWRYTDGSRGDAEGVIVVSEL